MSRLDFIETFTGRRFRPLSPDPEMICIEDIAHALSQQCRFSGHTIVPYSVAEHSCRVARLLKEWQCSRMVQIWGLLHDATEAFLVDIPSPLKSSPAFKAYRDAELALMNTICTRFGLPLEEPAMVRKADAVLLATEARDLMPFRPDHWIGLVEAPHPECISPWPAVQVENTFLKMFEALSRWSSL